MHPLLTELIQCYPDLHDCIPDVEHAVTLMETAFHQDGKLLVCGNGGSAADSEHIVSELMKGFQVQRPLMAETRAALRDLFPDDGDYLASHLEGALPAISLVSQTALNTAFANDMAADMIFAQQVYGYGRPGDVVLGISTSGNSCNVCRALQVGRAFGLHTIGLTGASGGLLAAICDVTIRVPASTVSKIQERHLPIYHVFCALLEQHFFPAVGNDAQASSISANLSKHDGKITRIARGDG